MQRWLDDVPVSVHAENILSRFRRSLKKDRDGYGLLLILVLIVALIGLASFVPLQNSLISQQENIAAAHKREVLTLQRRLAEKNAPNALLATEISELYGDLYERLELNQKQELLIKILKLLEQQRTLLEQGEGVIFDLLAAQFSAELVNVSIEQCKLDEARKWIQDALHVYDSIDNQAFNLLSEKAVEESASLGQSNLSFDSSLVDTMWGGELNKRKVTLVSFHWQFRRSFEF